MPELEAPLIESYGDAAKVGAKMLLKAASKSAIVRIEKMVQMVMDDEITTPLSRADLDDELHLVLNLFVPFVSPERQE